MLSKHRAHVRLVMESGSLRYLRYRQVGVLQQLARPRQAYADELGVNATPQDLAEAPLERGTRHRDAIYHLVNVDGIARVLSNVA